MTQIETYSHLFHKIRYAKDVPKIKLDQINISANYWFDHIIGDKHSNSTTNERWQRNLFFLHTFMYLIAPQS